MDSQSAEAQPAIRTPKGETIPDLRLFKYAPPEWVIDPFVGAGVSTAIVEPSPLVGGRYLITTALNASARGEVYLAIDLVEQRTCVLKRAPRNAAVGLDGTGAGDRLRNEAAILALLAPDPRFPA